MKGYINFRDIKGAIEIEDISPWHAAEYNSAPTHHLKGRLDSVRYSVRIIVFEDGRRVTAHVAEIIPMSGSYEFPVLVKKKDLKL